jgi:hypothetical protein
MVLLICGRALLYFMVLRVRQLVHLVVVEHWRNDTDRGNRKYLEISLFFFATLCTVNLTRNGPLLTPDLSTKHRATSSPSKLKNNMKVLS